MTLANSPKHAPAEIGGSAGKGWPGFLRTYENKIARAMKLPREVRSA